MNIIDKDFLPKQIRKVNYNEALTRNVRTGEISSTPSAVQKKGIVNKKSQDSIVLKHFVLYSSQMSESILARDILARVKTNIKPGIGRDDSFNLLSDTLKDLPEKTRQIFSGYLEEGKYKSLDDLIAQFDVKLKKLHTIMQNIDSLQDNSTRNPNSILEKIETEIRRGNTGQFSINADSAVKLLNA